MRIELFNGDEIKQGIDVAMRAKPRRKWLKYLDYFLTALYLCGYVGFIVFVLWLIF